MLTRRQLAHLAASSLGAALLSTPRRAHAADWVYGNDIVIDGQGGPGDPAEQDPLAPLSTQAIADARASGVTAFVITFAQPTDDFENTVTGLAAVENELDTHPETFRKVKRAADIRAAKADRRICLILALQNAAFAEGALGRVDVLHRLGLRVLQPTYNLRNEFGDGCLEPGNAGLSRQGNALVEKLNALRILVDVSHCGQRTTAETIAHSSAPVAITHAGCAALHDHPRNKRDDELRACAQRGGVAGIYFMPYLDEHPSLDVVVRHIEHALDVCGEDHVSIGTDNSPSPLVVTEQMKNTAHQIFQKRTQAGIATPDESPEFFPYVPDLNTPRRLETLARALLARKHPPRRVDKILGGNVLRVFGDVWG